jgi:hypothetical protein
MPQFEVKIEASGEVRDADGNLLHSEPVTITTTMSEQELREHFQLTDEQVRALKEDQS